ncbi:MAG: Pseudouridine synthase [Candidatus Magasanikbacteria bacterium GW2011_GWA2_45_39]|uniref:Pseudouridine synthase n=1 Tax=Candidatus Magasanikbacteria bacterium GW2011_GWA2_45_39 TaxID=1619041 RepID=A0A0G1MDF7_9BACT|nr:MAG: Pseudouridine synthase [Candidatus Magasanikbacteria bacterium GW2011_GWA2_45_39]HBW73801.1 RNA pseudouridine synthase [Candidatus Magasanikbacteria bacterium]
MKLQILYEDNHLIAVYKPAGVLIQGDETGDHSLMDDVKEFIKERDQKPGNVFLGLIHRLDQPVQGIVLFAKTSKGASRLAEQFREHKVRKIYHAVVEGVPPEIKGKVVSFLSKDRVRNKTSVHKKEQEGSKRAELSYKMLQSDGKRSLVAIYPITGRPHQIRAQLAELGCPIVGDLKYGARAPLPDKSVALAATGLTFHLATKDEEKTLEVDIPSAWKNFIEA